MNWPKKTSNDRNFAMFVMVSIFFVPILQQSIFANHGKEIDLKFSDAQFLILPGKNIHQVKFTTTYSVSDSDTVGKVINVSMNYQYGLIKQRQFPMDLGDKLDFSTRYQSATTSPKHYCMFVSQFKQDFSLSFYK